MKGKKAKGKKGAKKEVDKPKEELPPKIDFSENQADVHYPIYVKIKNKKETFFIFTEEFKKSIEIKEEIAKIKEISLEDIRLYYNNKRLIEDSSTNHDQQIKHATLLFAAFKDPDTNEWDKINDLVDFKVD